MALQIAQNYEYLGNDLWKWWVWLDGDDAELDTVEAVEYHLHPTFPNPVKEVKNRHTRFRLDSGGWGVFLLNARVRLTDGSVVRLAHMLELFYPEGTDDTPEEAPMRWASVSAEASGGPDRATRPDRRRSVFLSSGSADNALASELESSLTAHGLDVRSDRDLEPGVPWDIEIERTIGNADAVVVLSSDIPSKWVDREVGVATQLGVKVIPVAIGRDAVVPSSLPSLQQIQIESGERMGEATDSILRALEGEAMAENWTDLAPHPDPVEPGKKWHVFVSYRSTHRPWVLALYDILNGLGYKVFLDQYVLTAAAPLALSLGEALDSSESAILVWSGSFEDSEWCKQEASTLWTKQNQKDGFRYAIAWVDGSEITGLAQTKLWVDFSQQREGPSGTSLLTLLYGLEGEPLPPGAVKMAAQVDEEMREGLHDIEASRGIGDAAGLVALAETDNMAWRGSPMLVCAAAEGLIAMKKIPEAITVLERAEQAFPKAVRPKQLRGLALARSGQTSLAQRVLGRLYAAGEIGPETLGIFARTWMDRYNETGERTFLLKSRDLYRQAFEAFPTDYYTGINAASKSLLAGEKETAAQIAERVQQIVGDKAVANDYWRTATLAEALLMQGKVEAAAKTYRAAVVDAPLDWDSHDATRAQAALLLSALGATDEQKALVMAAFPAGAKTST